MVSIYTFVVKVLENKDVTDYIHIGHEIEQILRPFLEEE